MPLSLYVIFFITSTGRNSLLSVFVVKPVEIIRLPEKVKTGLMFYIYIYIIANV